MPWRFSRSIAVLPRHRAAWWPLAVLFLVGASRPLHAQLVRGTLRDELSAEPIAGGFVIMLDATGAEVTRALTDPRGRFQLSAPGPGAFSLRAVVVGRRSWTGGPRAVAAGETLEQDIAMPSVAVRLPVLVVEADRECRVRPEEGVAAGRLWEEAGKVLQAVVWSEREGVLNHRTVTYTRELDPRTLRVLEQETRNGGGWVRGSSFVSSSPDVLLAEGFIRPEPSGGHVYDAPDGAVLLSEPFADLHCFTVREPGGDQPACLVGLAFEPVRDRGVADVRGVLWLDAASAELRYLEFGYTRVPWDFESPLVGGRIDFHRLPQGIWIVSRWYIRMPQIGLRPAGGVRSGQPLSVLQGIRESGGWVDEVRDRNGEIAYRVASAHLRGTLTRPDGRGLANATMRVLGTAHDARTDEHGRFAFDSLPSGEHLLVYAHASPAMERLPAPPYPVHLGGGDTAEVRIEVPTAGDLLAAYCPDLGTDGTRGMVGGIVRDLTTGAPVRDIRVHVSWAEWGGVGERRATRTLEAQAVSDETGFYAVCGVPAQTPLRVWPSAGARVGRESEIRLGVARTARRDLDDPRPVR